MRRGLRSSMRSIGVTAGVVVAPRLFVASAGAATHHGENGLVTYTAAPGHDNVPQFMPSGPGHGNAVLATTTAKAVSARVRR